MEYQELNSQLQKAQNPTKPRKMPLKQVFKGINIPCNKPKPAAHPKPRGVHRKTK